MVITASFDGRIRMTHVGGGSLVKGKKECREKLELGLTKFEKETSVLFLIFLEIHVITQLSLEFLP